MLQGAETGRSLKTRKRVSGSRYRVTGPHLRPHFARTPAQTKVGASGPTTTLARPNARFFPKCCVRAHTEARAPTASIYDQAKRTIASKTSPWQALRTQHRGKNRAKTGCPLPTRVAATEPSARGISRPATTTPSSVARLINRWATGAKPARAHFANLVSWERALQQLKTRSLQGALR